jgi:hypothetical protein
MHALWAYESRLRFICILAALIDPDVVRDRRSRQRMARRFRDAVITYGSATKDNVDAASKVRVEAVEKRPPHTTWALTVAGQPLSRLLLRACDEIGTAEFFQQHLSDVPAFSRLSAKDWERAYRVLMLAAGALLEGDSFRRTTSSRRVRIRTAPPRPARNS